MEYYPVVADKVCKNVFKQIFHDHWRRYRDMNPKYNTEYYGRVIKKMLGCSESENGFLSYRCLSCGEVKKVPFSCKSSFCLSCAKTYTEEWVDYISKALFSGMRYRHLVLTVPERLRKWLPHDNGKILGKLMQAGHAFFRDAVSLWVKEEVDVGSIVVLQTAGRSANANPHLHIICTSGGLTKDGRWKDFGYIDFTLLHRKWQYYLLSMLKDNIDSEELRKEVDDCWQEYPKGFVAYIEKGDVPAGGKGLAHYLAKYVVSPPIALKRIIKYDGKNVRYWYKDHATGRRQEEEVDALTFIGRMVQHILPKGFQRIRYYGLHAICKAPKVREQLDDLPDRADKEVKGTYRVTDNSYRERMKRNFGVDPLKCPKCGEEMVLDGIWHPEHGWIVDNYDKLFMEVREDNGKKGEGEFRESVVQLQLPFM
jgi:hypothetical protein